MYFFFYISMKMFAHVNTYALICILGVILNKRIFREQMMLKRYCNSCNNILWFFYKESLEKLLIISNKLRMLIKALYNYINLISARVMHLKRLPFVYTLSLVTLFSPKFGVQLDDVNIILESKFILLEHRNFSSYIFLVFSVQIFIFGLIGAVFNKRNFISLLIAIEIMFLGIILFFSGVLAYRVGELNFSAPFLILALVACESALGLSLVIFMYKSGWKTDNILFLQSQVLTRGGSDETNLYAEDDLYYNDEIEDDNNESEYCYDEAEVGSAWYKLPDRKSWLWMKFKDRLEKWKNEENSCLIFFFLSLKNYEYINILIFWLVVCLLLVLLVAISKLIALHKPSKQKLSSYECGFEPFSDSRGRYDVLFYIVAILFILFDIEIVMLFPWTLEHANLPTQSYILIYLFIFTLILGFFYEWRAGALSWLPDDDDSSL